MRTYLAYENPKGIARYLGLEGKIKVKSSIIGNALKRGHRGIRAVLLIVTDVAGGTKEGHLTGTQKGRN